MGQVLGFSHCKEFGSVSSTPDSTPPCTDGGNEESDFPELQTARDWSDDEEGRGGPDDEDDGGASSPSIWGTPRQSSLELTFSYIALSEAEASTRREHGGRRRSRGGSRGGRGTSLTRTDTAETILPPLDSPLEQWDPHFLSGDGEEEQEVEEEEEERRRKEERDILRERLCPELLEIHSRTMQHLGHDITLETQDVNTGSDITEEQEISGTQHEPTDSQSVLQVKGPTLPVVMETSPVVPHVAHADKATPSTSSAPTGRSTQEELASLGQSALLCTAHRSVMDLIYWKDTERTGMVLTGVVVALLSLFQLSIITVISTLSLAIMCFTISVRVYYRVLQAIQWADGSHPFQKYLDLDITLHGEEADRYMQKAIVLACSALDSLKNLFFVSSLFDSLKFLLLMYLVTFLGNLCNGLTLLIVGVISVFALPLFYKQHQGKVDGVIAGVYGNIDNVKDFFQRLAQGGGPPPDPTPGGAKPKAK